MKKILLLIICIIVSVPSLVLANETPKVGVMRTLSYGLLISDNNSKELLTTSMDELFKNSNKLNKYEYVPFDQLRKSIILFADKEKVHSAQDLTTDELVKFGKEQNLDYVLYADYNRDNIKFATAFMGLSCDVSLGMTAKLVNVNTAEVIYLDHLNSLGKATSEVRAVREAIPPLMQKFAEQFKPGELVK